MISISEAISELLFVRDIVTVPELGSFVKTSSPASANVITNHFTLPSSEVSFDPLLCKQDTAIADYVADRNGISTDEAGKLLMAFVSDCFESMNDGLTVVIDKVGALSYDGARNVVFKPDTSTNFNDDAFGLDDFYATTVQHSETREEIQSRIARQQQEKNTKMTVDDTKLEEAREEDDPERVSNHRRKKRRLIFAFSLLALIIAGLVYIVLFWKPDNKIDVAVSPKADSTIVIRNDNGYLPEMMRHVVVDDSVKVPELAYAMPAADEQGYPVTIPVTVPEIGIPATDTLSMPQDSAVSQTTDVVTEPFGFVFPSSPYFVFSEPEPSVADTAEVRSDSLVQQPVAVEGHDASAPIDEEPVSSPSVEGKILIIGGCYSSPENAERVVNDLHEKGYDKAFAKKRGNTWDIVFGRYNTMEEAKTALDEIRSNGSPKAWILSK